MALVPLRISYNNLRSLLLNAFLPDWLTSFMNYPLGIQNVASVRLRRGKSGVHLDNKEHAILSHCLAFDKTKLATAQLGLNLIIDIDHWREAKAHRGFIIAQREEQGLRDPEVCSSLTVSLLNFSCFFPTATRLKLNPDSPCITYGSTWAITAYRPPTLPCQAPGNIRKQGQETQAI